jgi:multidrug efflux pump subunit AcrA (membrane-fusion protein)
MKVSLTLSQGLVFASLLSAACGSRGEATQQAKPPTIRTSLEARWVPLRAPRSVSFLELPATVLAAAGATAAMNPPYSGQVVKVHTRVGEQVKRGQPVADIMMPAVVAAAAENAAAHTKIDAYLSRMGQLKTLKAEGLARTADIADVEMRLAEARADQIRAEAVLRSAGVDPRGGARLVTSGGVVPLRSPIDGVVTEISAALGETRDSAGAPFARIAGVAPARIEARAPQRLPAGARFELVTAAGEQMPLRLVGEAPVVDPRDGTTAAWFEPEPARALPGGLTGRVRVILPDRAGLTIAPASAVSKRGVIAFVRARRGDDTAEVPVKIVQSSGADVLIESSLAAGSEIAERVAEPGR